MYIKEELYRYLLKLVTATREHPYIRRGASPRATIALVKLSKAAAWYQGRNFVTPNDVADQFPYVISHRLIPKAAVRLEQTAREALLREVLRSVKKPAVGDGRP